ncbi:hypothetical protein COLU111180_02925 [Cohnella lubricantis]|uniref:Uncharacterized protein n=1 Tax=Cohnella lubricantis TaxID=2163172 RepID=A0A841TI30_9BACL|nr:hypothetical protein [Cohnella lubricantis]MBB6679805.1 hypothetical protein [Cohnella lubricantis]MBP2118766.1 hypothetical protein [Cohnella lubricantis]
MNWEQQLELIEREVTAKAQQDPAFAELVKNDYQEAVKQATGLDLPFHLLDGLQTPEPAAASGELTDDDLLEVVGGVDVSSIDISGMDIETALMAVQSQRAALIDDQIKKQLQDLQNQIGDSSQLELNMLRLQSLANKRNEAFDVMTSFIQKMQDSRNAIIGNMR